MNAYEINAERVLRYLQEHSSAGITDLVNGLGLSRLDVATALVALEHRCGIQVIPGTSRVRITQ